jgi:MFS transporter, DHA2 family, methylenomycin A resistance protein
MNDISIGRPAIHARSRRGGRAVSIWAAGASLALTTGPFVGGVLIAVTGWRAIFLVNLPIGLAGLWLTRIYAQEKPAHGNREIDLLGQVAAIAALGALAASLIEGGAGGWSDGFVVAGFVLASAAGVSFVRQESRTQQPMLPLSLFGNRVFVACAMVGLLVNISIYGLIFVFSLCFQQINHFSAFATGLAFVPMMAVVLPANLIAPHLTERVGARATIAARAVLSASGCAALLATAPGTHYWRSAGS